MEPIWEVALEAPILHVRFPRAVETLSWAIWNGGRRCTDAVAWLEVRNADLPVGVDPLALIEERLAPRGLRGAVGLLTSRRLDGYREARVEVDGIGARSLATVGLSNALAVGDPPGSIGAPPPVAGTINVLCAVSAPLTEVAALEALAIMVEARTAAVLATNFPSRRSRRRSTGTGTDCMVLAWPSGTADPLPYAGKHTAVGAAVGRAVEDAVAAGVTDWRAEYRC